MTTTPDPSSAPSTPAEGSQSYGEIVDILLREGCLTADKVSYALRVQSKLETSRSLLDVLKELKYISDETVRDAIRNNRVSMRIGSLLVELGEISETELLNAIAIQSSETPKRKLGEVLVAHHFIDEQQFVKVLSLQMGYPYIEPEFAEINPELFTRVPIRWYDMHKLIPVRMEEREVLVAFADPLDRNEIEAARQVFGQNVRPAIARESSIRAAIEKLRSGGRRVASTSSSYLDSAIGIVDSILQAAIKESASDIHIEPYHDRLHVRFRQDGVLCHHKDFSRELTASVTSRLKVMCKADISEKRRHQGGRFLYTHDGLEVDLRASFFATVHGEKIVLRLLNRQAKLLNIDDIGMSPRIQEAFLQDALYLPSGVILITGPTGSGKTTTVYSCINHINNPQISIVTAEEPVEYIIDGVSQCSIDPRINLTFEETLRHIVRQDPDVILIGEIRDHFSAEVAVQAALTGHKVLTTFHTEDSIGGLVRLLNMDIAPFLISSTVVSVVAQRLLRKVCAHCGAPHRPEPGTLQRIGFDGGSIPGGGFMAGPGCTQCRHTGYLGRVGVFELLVLNELVRNAILEQRTSYEIRQISIDSTDLVTLAEDGLVKAAMGSTTLEEVLRCLPRLHKPRPVAELRRLLGW
jgi:type IV pilus assembly protein PilB